MNASEIGVLKELRKLLYIFSIIQHINKVLPKKSRQFLTGYIFIYYVYLKVKRLLKTDIFYVSLPDKNFKKLIHKYYNEKYGYIDFDCCALTSKENIDAISKWYYLCSKESHKKYKINIIPCDMIPKCQILISNTMKFNLGTFYYKSCFLLPAERCNDFASEAKISMIKNPYDCPSNLTDDLLKNYFTRPKFLRKNDVFCIDVNECHKTFIFSNSSPVIPIIYFKLISLKNDTNNNGLYIMQRETQLLQKGNINSFIPGIIIDKGRLNKLLDNEIENIKNFPFTLVAASKQLKSCILPFYNGIYKTNLPNAIRPLFLVKGSRGCGKKTLIKNCAKEFGLHLLNIDLAEIQTLTSAQTEVKLRIILQNAKNLRPCLLCLNNLQVYGKDAEGHKDERAISAFELEIQNIFNKCDDFPIIIVATVDDSEILGELERMFLETINVGNPDQNKQEELILQCLNNKNVKYTTNFGQVAKLCPDFNLTDISTLISNAIKIKHTILNNCEKDFELNYNDFAKAYEYMHVTCSMSEGMPKIPKVYWEDIGGLVSLKKEIMKRIQLPLLKVLGYKQSGLLLYGPPGTGKTLLAKAVATEYQLHFLSVKGPEVLNMYVGQSEKNIREIFEQARAAAPCIIFFDELDSLAPNRGRSGDSGGVMDRVVSQLLAEMDGLEDSGGIFIIGATNRPDLIDPALLRPGRFDKMLYVGIHSDKNSKLSVLQALTRKFSFSNGGKELEKLVEKLPDNLTGADLYAVCSDAWLHAARRALTEYDNNTADLVQSDNIMVELQDFEKAAKNLVPSVSETELKRYEQLRQTLST
ncbi:peroxisomal ATPase PEX6 [Prorops nasuta]|uniref:peroxisomal ATPase PEX6 n=1 Tax=Prorops nasuta TaxID=863751 RepID=UPI0034CE2777